MLPNDFPGWKLEYYYFCKWKRNGTIEEVHEVLRTAVRKAQGKKASPTLTIIGSQSVKMSRQCGIHKGIDGGKNIKGRKRQIIVYSMGLILVADVHAANIHGSKAALKLIHQQKYRFPKLAKIVANGGYRGALADKVKNCFGRILQVFMRKDAKKFDVLPKSWIV
jgi:putative transposase